MKDTLPNLPSEILEVALGDLEVVEKDPRYRINMVKWHFRQEGVCFVCHAGAVMANSLGVSDQCDYNPTDFNETVKAKLSFINKVRTGRIDSGLIDLRDADVINHEQIDAFRSFMGLTEYESIYGLDMFGKVGLPDDVMFYQEPTDYKNYIQDVIGFFKAMGL